MNIPPPERFFHGMFLGGTLRAAGLANLAPTCRLLDLAELKLSVEAPSGLQAFNAFRETLHISETIQVSQLHESVNIYIYIYTYICKVKLHNSSSTGPRPLIPRWSHLFYTPTPFPPGFAVSPTHGPRPTPPPKTSWTCSPRERWW